MGPLFGSGGGRIRRWNVDGLLSYDTTAEGRVNRYSQLFRNGIYEGVERVTLVPRVPGNIMPPPEPHVRATWVDTRLASGLANPLAVQRMIGVRSPVSVLLSVVGARGVLLAPSDPYGFAYEWSAIDRDLLTLPDDVIESLDIDLAAELPHILGPVMDGFWQACGFERSQTFDAKRQLEAAYLDVRNAVPESPPPAFRNVTRRCFGAAASTRPLKLESSTI